MCKDPITEFEFKNIGKPIDPIENLDKRTRTIIREDNFSLDQMWSIFKDEDCSLKRVMENMQKVENENSKDVVKCKVWKSPYKNGENGRVNIFRGYKCAKLQCKQNKDKFIWLPQAFFDNLIGHVNSFNEEYGKWVLEWRYTEQFMSIIRRKTFNDAIYFYLNNNICEYDPIVVYQKLKIYEINLLFKNKAKEIVDSFTNLKWNELI